MFKNLFKEICNMSNLLFGIFILSIQVMICSLVVTIATVAMNDDLVKEVVILKNENTELKWEIDQVDQMICNNEVKDAETETN